MSEKYRVVPFFNGVSTFKAAFPQLTDATIEWRERRGPDDTSDGELRKTGFRRGNFTQGLLPCSNPACHEGGYEVDRLIAEMLQLAETDREGTLFCTGREGGDEMRRGPVRCSHRINYKVTLSHRSPEKPEKAEKPEKDNKRQESGDRRRYNNRRGGRNRQRGRGAVA